MISIPYRRSLLVALLAFTVLVAGRVAAQVNAEQSLRFAGLRSVNQAGEAKAVVTDAVGDIYLAYDQGDGVRLLKVANDGNALLGQVQLGAKGDSAVALAIDPAGNLYVAGTSTSGALEATPGAAIPVATPGTTNSFVAKFDGNLDELFLTFTGGSRIAASAVAASADAVAVTGITYGSDLPVTANAILQSPAYGSFQNGFVESFSADGSTIEYATYITGALGDTTPTGIALDAVDDVYLAGATTASGFPTVNALIPNSLSNPSGFLLSLTPAGDGIDFSTFVPGPGLSAVALDATGQNLLVTGAVNLGAFPVDTVTAPLVSTIYQVLLRMPLDGSSVESGTVLAAAQASSVAATSDGGAWIGGAFPQGQAPLLAYPPLAGLGGGWAVHLTVQGAVDQTLRLGGQANQQQAFASLPSPVEGVAADSAGDLFVAGAIQPTASSSLLATETYDLPLRGGPTLALPSALADAKATAATCSGSLCGGSAGFLASVSVQAAQPALAFSLDDLPMVRLRNLGSAAATALQLAASAGSFSADCPTALPPGGVCEILLSGRRRRDAHGDLQRYEFGDGGLPCLPARACRRSGQRLPSELDFGLQSAASPPVTLTLTVANLGATDQTIPAGILLPPKATSLFSELASDCPASGSSAAKLIAAGTSCHITVGFSPASSAASDGFASAQYTVGSRQVALTGYSQAAALNVSAAVVDFGTEYQGSPIAPRFLYLTNGSDAAVAHAAASLPANLPFTVTDGCPANLAAHSVCRIRIDYNNPAPPADDAATLTLDQGLEVTLKGSSQPPLELGGVRRARHSWSRPPPGSSAMPSW